METMVLPRPSTTFKSMNFTKPLLRASTFDCSVTRVAVPPMWNVRIVSCVPGSPMDCAAITPTASPISTKRPGGQVAAVAARRKRRAGIRR